jgi:hypothetical protein
MVSAAAGCSNWQKGSGAAGMPASMLFIVLSEPPWLPVAGCLLIAGSHGFKPADPHFKETFTRANQQQM